MLVPRVLVGGNWAEPTGNPQGSPGSRQTFSHVNTDGTSMFYTHSNYIGGKLSAGSMHGTGIIITLTTEALICQKSSQPKFMVHTHIPSTSSLHVIFFIFSCSFQLMDLSTRLINGWLFPFTGASDCNYTAATLRLDFWANIMSSDITK